MFRPLSFYIGLRYTAAKRRNHFISFISLTSMIGLMLGVAVLIIVLSVMNGFDRELKQRILGMVPHATIQGTGPLDDWKSVDAQVEEHPRVLAAAPFIQGQGMVTGGGNVRGVVLNGILPEEERTVSIIENHMIEGRLDDLVSGEFGIIIGRLMAASLRLQVGDKVTVVLPEARGGMVSVVDRHRRMKVVGEAATALHRITKPTIAAVDGYAVGAGMNLALGCDVVIAAESALFSEIFVKRGLTLDFGGTWLLPRLVGLQRAKELALSGRMVGADEAVEIGLALEVVSAGRLISRAKELAESFLSGAPIGQMFSKQALDASFEMSFSEAIGWEGQSQSIALGTEDSAEGIAAFLEKREPQWNGR